MFSFTARTLRWFLSAGNTGSYFHRQDRMCLPFNTRFLAKYLFNFRSGREPTVLVFKTLCLYLGSKSQRFKVNKVCKERPSVKACDC
jgi:hypothetical protein